MIRQNYSLQYLARGWSVSLKVSWGLELKESEGRFLVSGREKYFGAQ